MKVSLNPCQQEAVCHQDGPMLILAGAGSGKTRVITHRVAYLIEQGIDPYHILAITFTNKAAGELRERVDDILGYGGSRVWVSTFHALCVRILRRYIDRLGYENNFTIYDTDDQKRLLREVTRYLNIDPKLYPERYLMSRISHAKENFQTPRDFELSAGTNYRDMQTAAVYLEYQKRLQKNNGLDFDDLLYLTVELFQDHPDVLEEYQNRFRYIMIDEYQDTNEIQFLLVRQLAAKYRNLCVVGDDDQSIYKFRGANIMNILNFEEEYPDAKVVKLEENYRSTSNILNAANSVIANNEGRKDKTLWTKREEGAKVVFKQYDDEYTEADQIAWGIMEMKAKMSLNYSDFAILYRTNAQSRVLEEKLIFKNIPYRVYGGQNFYGRQEVKDLLAYLRVLSNEADEISIKRIINVPKRGIGATTISKLEDYVAAREDYSFVDAVYDAEEIPGLGKAAEKLGAFVDYLEDLHDLLEQGITLTELFDQIMDTTGYREMLINEHTEESLSRLENLAELRNKIADYESTAEKPNLDEFLAEVSLVADVDNMNSIDERVVLMTVHSAKGLEFPVVYLAGMEDGMFPSNMSLNSGNPDDEEEERRLCYVAITRAKDRLFMSAARRRTIRGSACYNGVSRFVREIPEEYMDVGGYKKAIAEPVSIDPEPKVSPVFTKKPSFGKEFKAPEMAGPPDYGVGDRVEHVKFGVGTVVSLAKSAKDYEVEVDFGDYGRRRLLASFAKLKKV